MLRKYFILTLIFIVVAFSGSRAEEWEEREIDPRLYIKTRNEETRRTKTFEFRLKDNGIKTIHGAKVGEFAAEGNVIEASELASTHDPVAEVFMDLIEANDKHFKKFTKTLFEHWLEAVKQNDTAKTFHIHLEVQKYELDRLRDYVFDRKNNQEVVSDILEKSIFRVTPAVASKWDVVVNPFVIQVVCGVLVTIFSVKFLETIRSPGKLMVTFFILLFMLGFGFSYYRDIVRAQTEDRVKMGRLRPDHCHVGYNPSSYEKFLNFLYRTSPDECVDYNMAFELSSIIKVNPCVAFVSYLTLVIVTPLKELGNALGGFVGNFMAELGFWHCILFGTFLCIFLCPLFFVVYFWLIYRPKLLQNNRGVLEHRTGEITQVVESRTDGSSRILAVEEAKENKTPKSRKSKKRRPEKELQLPKGGVSEVEDEEDNCEHQWRKLKSKDKCDSPSEEEEESDGDDNSDNFTIKSTNRRNLGSGDAPKSPKRVDPPEKKEEANEDIR